MYKTSHEVSVDSRKLSKLASAFEESLRISRDCDRGDGSGTSSVDSERPDNPPNTRETSLDVSIMERCLAAMTQSSSRCSSQEPEARDGLVADGDDDDEDCSSLLASLSDLQSQLQKEIGQTQRRLHGASDKHRTRCKPKRNVESTSDSNTGVEDSSRSRLEDATSSRCNSDDQATDCASTTTTAGAVTLPAATTTTKSTTRVTTSTTGCCLLFVVVSTQIQL